MMSDELIMFLIVIGIYALIGYWLWTIENWRK